MSITGEKGRWKAPGQPLDTAGRAAYLEAGRGDLMASAAFEDIVDTFEFLEDWEDRYRHVIDLGRAMEPLEPALRVPATKVEGCASQVWIVPEIAGSGAGARFDFRGESDAMIVSGLIAILRALYNGLTAVEVMQVDAPAELGRLGLGDHLSAQRSNGLRAMVERIRKLAAAAQSAESAGARSP
jgi:cysteine desulfuration protein SufE